MRQSIIKQILLLAMFIIPNLVTPSLLHQNGSGIYSPCNPAAEKWSTTPPTFCDIPHIHFQTLRLQIGPSLNLAIFAKFPPFFLFKGLMLDHIFSQQYPRMDFNLIFIPQ
jgi:hypothetical protein